MEVRYISLDTKNFHYLSVPTNIKDRHGISWKITCFRVYRFTGGKSIYIKYYNEKMLPMFQKIKRLKFDNDGSIYCKVCNEDHWIGTWNANKDMCC